jgi:hypothetical protein
MEFRSEAALSSRKEGCAVRSKDVRIVICLILSAILSVIPGCATQKATLPIENSLPQSKLEYYNDSFDKLREDLWDRAGYLPREEQVKNFKQADMRFDNGKLIIRTHTGSFSKAGLSSKYALRGNFDIQLNCRMDFIKGISGMDQVFTFGVYDKSLKKGELSFAIIGLFIEGGFNTGYLFGNCAVNGINKRGSSHRTENFNGTFRIVRSGKTVSTFYKNAEATEWAQINNFQVTDKDMMIGFQLRNFFLNRTIIEAKHSISAEVDSLKINAAREIIEEEI